MPDEERTQADGSEHDEPKEAGEASDGSDAGNDGGSEPGDWERKPSEPEDRRHDDGSAPLAKPSDDDDEDVAEQQAGDVTSGDDEGFDRPEPPDETGVGEAGQGLQDEAEPLLGGRGVSTPAGPLPTLSLVGMAVFVAVFCIAFFALWALLGGIGILVGIVVGTALGLGAMKLLADRAR
ncbi:MAG: hypothetical protein WKF62_02220 [Solirubrobacterales bacterium]